MVRTLRQGIGRLVRREGVPARHLWMADRRLTCTQKASTAYAVQVRKVLGKYRVAA